MNLSGIMRILSRNNAVPSDPPPIPIRICYVPWLIPTWARAQTWWNLILLRKGVGLTERLLAHELAHVLQWRAFGVVGFICRYAGHLIRQGYLNNPLEIAARQAEEDDFFVEWAREVLLSREKPKHCRQS